MGPLLPPPPLWRRGEPSAAAAATATRVANAYSAEPGSTAARGPRTRLATGRTGYTACGPACTRVPARRALSLMSLLPLPPPTAAAVAHGTRMSGQIGSLDRYGHSTEQLCYSRSPICNPHRPVYFASADHRCPPKPHGSVHGEGSGAGRRNGPRVAADALGAGRRRSAVAAARAPRRRSGRLLPGGGGTEGGGPQRAAADL